MLHPAVAARVVERVLERAQAVVERRVRILVRLPGVRDRGQVHDRLGLDVVENARHRVVVASVLDRQTDVGLAQQIEALGENPRVQLARAGVIVPGCEAIRLLTCRLSMTLTSAPSRASSSARWWPMKPAPPRIAIRLPASVAHAISASVRRRTSPTYAASPSSRCGPTGSAIERSLIAVAFGNADPS